MAYLYHMVPPNLEGRTLYCLKELEHRNPEIFEKAAEKYRDHPTRYGLPERIVPILGCRWCELVQFAPIHPGHIYQGLLERGFKPNPKLRFFRIPVAGLKRYPAVVYGARLSAQGQGRFFPEDFTEFSYDSPVQLNGLTEDSRQWLDRLREKGQVFGMFVGIPHILIQGEVSLEGAEEMVWSESIPEV